MLHADLFGSTHVVLLSISNGESVEGNYLHGSFLHGIPAGFPCGPNNAIVIAIRSRCLRVSATCKGSEVHVFYPYISIPQSPLELSHLQHFLLPENILRGLKTNKTFSWSHTYFKFIDYCQGWNTSLCLSLCLYLSWSLCVCLHLSLSLSCCLSVSAIGGNPIGI